MSPTKLAKDLGLSRRQAQRNLADGMPSTPKGAREWRTARVRPALNNTVSADDIHELRAQLVRAQGIGEELKNKLRQHEVVAAEKELVPASAAREVIATVVRVVRGALPGVGALARRCNPTDPALAAGALAEWRDRTAKLLDQAASRTKKHLG